ncbi:MAG: hypothetical protein HQL45_15965 [Alphaproteobacteria bacterium]|nr:hypothetical protein [Alphaproteobacteria bacterium]
MNDIKFRPLRYRKRWFAYLDLLGFKNLVHSESIEDVLEQYLEVLRRMQDACRLGMTEAKLINAWFSDTFIIYTGSDSPQDFAYLEQAARIFFQLLLNKHIPVRGCISHGELYSQSRRNIFIGPALIEAHFYGEALNWVGLCLAPSAEEKLKNDLPPEKRPFYRKVSDGDILRKAKEKVDHLYAFAFNNGRLNGRNQYRESLQAMKSEAVKQGGAPEVIKKYEHALAFLDQHAEQRVMTNDR